MDSWTLKRPTVMVRRLGSWLAYRQLVIKTPGPRVRCRVMFGQEVIRWLGIWKEDGKGNEQPGSTE